MGDKDTLQQLQKRIRVALDWQERIREVAASAALEKEERERQEQG